MYSDYFFTGDVTVLVSMFGLAWFLAGLGCGVYMSSERKQPRSSRPRSKTKSSRNGRIELYVGNLSYDTSEKELSKEFKNYGNVCSVRIIRNRANGKSKGYGFLEMDDRNECDAAVRAMNGKSVGGRKLVVNEAKSHAR